MHPQYQPQPHRHRPPRKKRIPKPLLFVGIPAFLIAAVIVGTDDDTSATSDSKPRPSASATADKDSQADTERSHGIPPEPTGADRTAYLDAIAAVDPTLTAEPDKAIDAGRNQCSALDGGAQRLDYLAAQRFGNDAHPLTDAQGAELNAALRKTLCPKE
ncbi:MULTISPECIES: DUF732 domain-containing protein [Streptomyces]|nr:MULTISPECIES: DUF732 domain-containing protein [Streptomyces]